MFFLSLFLLFCSLSLVPLFLFLSLPLSPFIFLTFPVLLFLNFSFFFSLPFFNYLSQNIFRLLSRFCSLFLLPSQILVLLGLSIAFYFFLVERGFGPCIAWPGVSL